MVAAAAVVCGPTAGAQEDAIEIPLDSVVRADEGSETELGSAPVPAELQGATCEAEAQADNQESVHPGNDLVVTTGGVEAVIPGVEDEPGQVSVSAGTVVLGETITVSLRMGPDEVFSGGLVVSVDCTAPPETGTTDTTTATGDGADSTDDTPTDDTATAGDDGEGDGAGAGSGDADADGGVSGSGAEAPASGAEVAGESELAFTGPRAAGAATVVGTVLLMAGAAFVAVGRRFGVAVNRPEPTEAP
ncbi:MAG: hypothetical protein S0880_19400 [Actinomycetota bacterium]|nr:hypothetical protein [Actinomycetota bacterium]